MESIHSFGLCLLVFRIIPKMSIDRGLLLLSAVGTLPAILKPVACADVAANGRCIRSTAHRIAFGFVDTLALIGQLSVFPIAFAVEYIPSLNDGSAARVLEIVGALLFVSFGWWENFMDGLCFVTLKESNMLKNFMLKVLTTGT